MVYLISFLEGITTFISPCLLPMLPIYLSYFAGQEEDEGTKKHRTLINALGFTAGFTVVFVALGAFAGTLGSFLTQHITAVNIVLGMIMVLFGLHFMEFIRIPLLNRQTGLQTAKRPTGFFSAALFGMIFSVSWTPCVGAFLGSALMLAASQGGSLRGIFLLLSYSAGLAIPFVISALLIHQLRGAFDWIKKHYRIIRLVSGGFLVLVGVMMAAGWLGQLLNLLSGQS